MDGQRLFVIGQHGRRTRFLSAVKLVMSKIAVRGDIIV